MTIEVDKNDDAMSEGDANLITCCPACGTRFRLSTFQLEAADGAVRCGACLEVFTAVSYLVADSETEEIAPFIPGQNRLPGQNRRSNEETVDADEVTAQPEEPRPIFHLLEEEALEEDVEAGLQLPNEESETEEPETEEPDLDEETKDQLADTVLDALHGALDEENENQLPVKRGLLVKGVLAMVLMLILVGQFAWFGRSQYAAQEDFRHYYLQGCGLITGYLECNLPDYINLKQISTRNLIVRTHPKLANALVIDAIILNESRFDQPFPKLELKFTDLDFRPVASRLFTPAEYLAGELTGMKYIPASTEVRVSLEIVDPGEQAISYELYAVNM